LARRRVAVPVEQDALVIRLGALDLRFELSLKAVARPVAVASRLPEKK
jgi:hypothetical protein